MAQIQTFTPIAQTLLGSNVSSVSISSIDQTYDHLVITCQFTRNIAGNFGGRAAQFQWNGITSGYSGMGLYASGGGASYSVGIANGSSQPNTTAGNNYAQGRTTIDLWIPNYSATNFQKQILWWSWNNDDPANSGGSMAVTASLIPTTAALTSLYIFEVSETFISGDYIVLWGVKNA